ncbi:MAG: hypothetical protein NC084_06370 [Bacteroides sp.]|nr:hypothetical protein [Eubacterium sp.]MCM1418151.1 hypothetical protein [Roseburia sp.]MCM1462324.1 hypothetical protein [Bacteroides sp.]
MYPTNKDTSMSGTRPRVTVIGGAISRQEEEAYIKRGRDKSPRQKLLEVVVEVDGEYVNLSFRYEQVQFERIRRITGYLVGSLDRFNDAKRAEVADRQTHDLLDEIAEKE